MAPLQPPIKRSSPPKRNHYRDYEEDLRHDFFNTCAYCSVMEQEAGGVGFTVDHYVPKSNPEGKSLEHSFANLLWVCADCNSYKGTYWPTDSQREAGKVVIRPDEMIPVQHLDLDDEDPSTLQAKTVTGKFNLDKLDLNRPGLRKVRVIRNQLLGAKEYVRAGVAAFSSVAIDGLSKDSRGTFVQLRDRIVGKAKELEEEVDDLLREYARSPLRCPDPGRKERSKKRKDLLSKV